MPPIHPQPSPDAIHALRKSLWHAGYPPVPVYGLNFQGEGRGKRPFGEAWQLGARDNPPRATSEPPRPDALNTGVLCDGLRVIDIDIEDRSTADAIEAEARELLGLAPCRWRENSGKRALFYRAAEGEPKKASITGAHGKVEVLGHGQQVVTDGFHPSGVALKWRDADGVMIDGLDKVPRATLPVVSEDDVAAFLDLVQEIIGAKPKPLPVAAPALSAPIIAGDPDARRMKAAASKALHDEATKLAGMAKDSGRNDALNAIAYRLGRFIAGGGLTRDEVESALLDACSRNGLWSEGANACRATIKSGLEKGIAAGAPSLAEREKPAASAPQGATRGKIIDLSRDEDFVPPDEIVRDTIPATGVGFLGGQSGAFKTFAAIELGACLMTGEPFAGRKVERAGGVIYTAFEGAGTIAGRLKARRSKMADPSQELPFLMLEGFGTMAKPEDFGAFAATLREAARLLLDRWGAPLAAIIIDTVAASGAIPEDKENDPGAWQRVFDGLNPISQELAAPVILIHHFGKSADAGLRGSSNARAGADFVLAMTCDRDEQTGSSANHRLALSKSRTAPEGVIGGVTSEAVQIGTRPDGSPVTSLVLNFDTDTKIVTLFRQRKPNRRDRAFSEALTAALIDSSELVHVHGQSTAPRVTATQLTRVREEFGKRYVTSATDDKKRADTIRKQFSAAIDRATAAQQIFAGSWGGNEWLWSAKAGGDDAE